MAVNATPAPDPSGPEGRAPAPLVAAASLVAVESMLLLSYGVAEVVSTTGDRITMGLSTSVFFLAYGAGMGWCAWSLTRLRPWSRSPVVLAQLIQLGVAWSFRGGATLPVAIGLAVIAVLVLAGVFHPASVAALDDSEA